MNLLWERFDHTRINDLRSQTTCLYVFYHPSHGDRPYYIGKAKKFGKGSTSRYNSGYTHLIAGMLESGFVVYTAALGAEFSRAECYEQELIAQWNPIRIQKRKSMRLPVTTYKPWR